MWTFLALSGIIAADPDRVFDALAAHLAASGGLLQRCDGTTEEPGAGALHAHDAKVSALYPNGFDAWDAVATGDDKAYPDDEFPMGSDWQMCDFTRALGLPYPLDDAGNILGQAFRLTHARARKP